MNKPSKSPDRHTFQKTGYEQRLAEKGETPSEAYLDYFEKIIDDHEHKFDDPVSRRNNMEYDLLTTDWILEKVRANTSYAQNLYAAMCNTEFQKRDLWPILAEQTWSCTWRYAGGIIADMLGKGDYIDWYMSGMGGVSDYDIDPVEWAAKTGYVPEGKVTDEINDDLFKLGWIVIADE
jgi:hypothetical protein